MLKHIVLSSLLLLTACGPHERIEPTKPEYTGIEDSCKVSEYRDEDNRRNKLKECQDHTEVLQWKYCGKACWHWSRTAYFKTGGVDVKPGPYSLKFP